METSFSLRVPREERPALLWPTSDLQNCRLTNGYCLSHSLLYFATWLQKAERMVTGADEGARAGDHICLLVASPYQPRAWPKHSLPSGRLGDPRHLCSAPRSPPESLPASLKQEILLREKSEQEECLVFPSSHFARGDFKHGLLSYFFHWVAAPSFSEGEPTPLPPFQENCLHCCLPKERCHILHAPVVND